MTIPTSNSNLSVNISYWELKHYFSLADLIVVGAGIVGLTAAIEYKRKHKKAKVFVLESGIIPMGASTKNAGFACFGSPSELLADLKKMPEDSVWETVQMRWNGLQLLRKNLGDKNIDFHNWGGYELFNTNKSFELCSEKLNYLNKKSKEYIGKSNCYSIANKSINKFGFNDLSGVILNKQEGQIDTSKLFTQLAELAQKNGVEIISGVHVNELKDLKSRVELNTGFGVFKCKKCIVAINGFAKELLKIKDVAPARAQVLITKPIKNLKIKGTFHYDEGFYYFRNIDGRLLFGGGRNLDFEGETTTELKVTPKIQNQLEHLLKTVILPKQKFEIEHRWAGIMGVGSEKRPIIKNYSANIVCAVRMGGMGVAIGSLVGKEAAQLVS